MKNDSNKSNRPSGSIASARSEIPTRPCTIGGVVIVIFSALAAVLGCGKRPAAKPPPRPTVADLKFPVVLIQDGMMVLPRSSPDELMRLHSNFLNMNIQVGKTLIDSDFRIYRVENLRSTRSGLGQMMNPVGITPIAFELTQTGRGLEPARAAILACQYLDESSLEVARKRAGIAKETTLAGMIQILQSADPTTQPAADADDSETKNMGQ